jgi:dolichyl-phosphate beta-glucosyltransferase
MLPMPLKTVDAAAIPAYFTHTARRLPDHSVVVVLPYPAAVNPVAMRWQAAAHYRFRMPGGYFLGPAADGHAYVGGSADPPTAALFTGVAQSGQAVIATPEQRRQAAQDFIAWRASRVVLGPDPAADALRATVTDLLGRQPTRIGGVDVWTGPVGN